jgi:hypothetical protein
MEPCARASPIHDLASSDARFCATTPTRSSFQSFQRPCPLAELARSCSTAPIHRPFQRSAAASDQSRRWLVRDLAPRSRLGDKPQSRGKSSVPPHRRRPTFSRPVPTNRLNARAVQLRHPSHALIPHIRAVRVRRLLHAFVPNNRAVRSRRLRHRIIPNTYAVRRRRPRRPPNYLSEPRSTHCTNVNDPPCVSQNLRVRHASTDQSEPLRLRSFNTSRISHRSCLPRKISCSPTPPAHRRPQPTMPYPFPEIPRVESRARESALVFGYAMAVEVRLWRVCDGVAGMGGALVRRDYATRQRVGTRWAALADCRDNPRSGRGEDFGLVGRGRGNLGLCCESG